MYYHCRSKYFSAKNVTIEDGDWTLNISIEGSLANLVDQMYNGEPIEIDMEYFTIIDSTSAMLLINGTTSRDELLPIYTRLNFTPTGNRKQYLCFNFHSVLTRVP